MGFGELLDLWTQSMLEFEQPGTTAVEILSLELVLELGTWHPNVWVWSNYKPHPPVVYPLTRYSLPDAITLGMD